MVISSWGTGLYLFSHRFLPTCLSSTMINLVYLLFCHFSWILQGICRIAQRSRKREDDDGRSLTLGLEPRSSLILGSFLVLIGWSDTMLFQFLSHHYLGTVKRGNWSGYSISSSHPESLALGRGKLVYSFQWDKISEDIKFDCRTCWQKLWSLVYLNKLSIYVLMCF